MPRLTRRQFMTTASMAVAGAMLPVWPGGTQAAVEISAQDYENLPPLRVTAAQKDILYGAAVGTPNLKKDQRFREAVIRECNVIVPEWEGKWKALMPEARGAWRYEPLDELVQFAQENAMKVRGTALIWHNAFPDWAAGALSEGQGASLMEEYIQTVVSRYRGRIFSWDVVNEAIDPKDGRDDGLRQCLWLEALGPAYIERAFRLAHEADPSAQLVYNDFAMEYWEEKADAVLSLLSRLKNKNVPLHAVGLQAHLQTEKRSRALAKFCAEVKKMELEILITELDIWDNFLVNDVQKTDQLAATTTQKFFELLMPLVRPKQILTWGLSDRYSWLSSKDLNKKNYFGKHVRGLPLDDNCHRKQMWNALHETLMKV